MKNFDTRNKTKIQNTIPCIRDGSPFIIGD